MLTTQLTSCKAQLKAIPRSSCRSSTGTPGSWQQSADCASALQTSCGAPPAAAGSPVGFGGIGSNLDIGVSAALQDTLKPLPSSGDQIADSLAGRRGPPATGNAEALQSSRPDSEGMQVLPGNCAAAASKPTAGNPLASGNGVVPLQNSSDQEGASTDEHAGSLQPCHPVSSAPAYQDNAAANAAQYLIGMVAVLQESIDQLQLVLI